jgi:YwiC-like protein
VLPKEHGAYGQMVFPLATSLAVGEVTKPALLLVVSVLSLFVAHEPLLVLLGSRGPRARREQRRRAAVWLGAAVTVALGAAAIALYSMSPETRWALGVPVLPAAMVAFAVAARREKSWYGETAVALAFSLAAVPVSVAAGAPTPIAIAIASVFGVTFVAQTLAVRSVILAVRGGGNPSASRAARYAASGVIVAGLVGISAAMIGSLLPWTTLAAVLPGVVATVFLVILPPPPTRLRVVGWTLVSTSVTTTAILVIWL